MRKITKKEKIDLGSVLSPQEMLEKYAEELINQSYGLPNNPVSTFSNSVPANNITQEDIEKWKKEFEELNKKYSGGIWGNPIPFYIWKEEVHPEPTFPEPNYDIIPSYNPMTGEQKEYWLPALKVLNWNEIIGWFVSPSRPAIWANDELEAEFTDINYFDYGIYGTSDKYLPFLNPNTDWGIYGGMNFDEILEFLTYFWDGLNVPYLSVDPSYPLSCRRLCIIEPFPDADVVICEQGWRAKKAFISEVVGETIDVDTASNLLSIAWNRKIDVRGLYENWKNS